MPLDWNDLRFFLAVMEHGSTKRAAVALRVNQTTCARRLVALEQALGLELFDRSAGRYEPTAVARKLHEVAAGVASALGGFETAAHRLRRAHARVIKVTCEEFWAPRLVLPALTELRDSNPEVQVEFDVTADSRDIAAGEADLALRSGPEPGDDSLIWRKLDDDPIGIYCAQSYPNPPTSLEQLGEHPFVGQSTVRPSGCEGL